MNIPERQSQHGQWSSRWTFILAATGAAVGLGNIWKFPYLTGQNGGSAFVLIYIICVAALGIPLMMAEILLGRRGRATPIHTMKVLAEETRNHPMVADHRLVRHHCGHVDSFVLQRHRWMDNCLYH